MTDERMNKMEISMAEIKVELKTLTKTMQELVILHKETITLQEQVREVRKDVDNLGSKVHKIETRNYVCDVHSEKIKVANKRLTKLESKTDKITFGLVIAVLAAVTTGIIKHLLGV